MLSPAEQNAQDMLDLNPRIRSIKIGIKKLYPMSVYPFSYADQIKYMDVVGNMMVAFSEMDQDQQTSMALIALVSNALRDHLPTIIDSAFDKEEWEKHFEGKKVPDITSQMDNDQLIELISMVIEMNYSELKKKFSTVMKDPMDRMLKSLIPSTSETKSESSSNTIPNIPLTTSSEEPLEMEDSLQDNSVSLVEPSIMDGTSEPS